LPRDGDFVKSVYGPYLKEKIGDHQFYLCATGKSGFKLADVISQLGQRFCFIDIGANIGLYSLLASRHPQVSEVFAIEPNPAVLSSLKENIAYQSAGTVTVLEGAVSKSPATIELKYDDWHLGMGSIEREGSNSATVKSYNREALSSLFSNIDEEVFVKVDVEGAEYEVLQEVFAAEHSEIIRHVFVEITPKWLSKEKLDGIFSLLQVNGFRLSWRSAGIEQYDAYFVKDKNHQLADEVRKNRLASIGTKPTYSVCIPNYNMSDTIYRAVSSVAKQLDENYEILIVDDGSSDESKSIINQLEAEYPIVRSLFLDRDKNRHLGETRNISVYGALGEYVLLHIDADDVWDPYLKDLVRLFHCLENAYESDFLLVGQQTGIVKRELLLGAGGYENIYRGEDRNLMFKLASQDKVLFLNYKTFRHRLSRPANKKYKKVIWDMWSHLGYDLMYCDRKFNYILVAMLFSYNNADFTFRTRLLRAAMVLPAWLRSIFVEKRALAMTWDDFQKHREERRGSFEHLMKSAGRPTNISDVVAGKAVEIFSYQMSNSGFKGE